ncbi:hypothetical protein [Chroococcidiopsis sp.]|uniref:hypothetical protein n=1 Tax=Chroococcidiopsis sp. TaxID=3088168 RepID=UPI003F35422F
MVTPIKDGAQIIAIKDILETQYSDGITSISKAELDDEDNIIGIFEDKISPTVTKRYAFKITDEEIGYRLMNAKEIANFIEEDEEDMNETDFTEREASLNATAAELAKQAQKIALRQAELDRKEDMDFAESLIKDGRALPNEKEKLVTMMGTMRQNETVVEFSEEDKPQMLDAFKEMLSKRPPVIAFGEHAKPDGKPKHGSINFAAPEGTEVDMEALEVHEKALAYQEAHPGTDYMSAISKVGY